MTDKRKEAENLEETRKFAQRVAQLQSERAPRDSESPPSLDDDRQQAAWSEYERPTNPNRAIYDRAVAEDSSVRQTVDTPFRWGRDKGTAWGNRLKESVSPETRDRIRQGLESYAEGMDPNYRRPQREPNKYEFQLAKAIDNADNQTYRRGREEPWAEPGNITLRGRPEIDNKDGTTSTVRSMSFNDGPGREVLVPTAYAGKLHSDEEAIENYRRTGKHLGIFKTPEEATARANRIHNEYASGDYRGDSPVKVQPDDRVVRRTSSGSYEKAYSPKDETERRAEHMKKFQPHPWDVKHQFSKATQPHAGDANSYNRPWDANKDTALAAEDVGYAVADKEAKAQGMQKTLGDKALDLNYKVWEPGGYLDRAGEALSGLVTKKKK